MSQSRAMWLDPPYTSPPSRQTLKEIDDMREAAKKQRSMIGGAAWTFTDETLEEFRQRTMLTPKINKKSNQTKANTSLKKGRTKR